ncbi:hypothetical protein HLI18_01345 [Rhizobium laguerreae]|uniref:hypothetical protein n=1 Tax=Rhizobium laguerreae TaxID=1076926 RepID=UPI00147970F0|nr:hypothetical protein [Rhizobium laguerreae]NNG68574.1 hypothetical protein [Rhizobium laguerreae]
MPNKGTNEKGERGSSPASRSAAGAYIEGELGAFYMLAMLAGIDARGMPGARLTRVRFQGVDHGFELDDIIIEGVSPAGETLLEIQSKRTITFAPKDPLFREIAGQIAQSKSGSVPQDRHLLAVASQRTSFKISGPYQDVLLWARGADSGSGFFARLNMNGVASQEMRDFVSSFRTNMVAAGVENDDETIWRLLRRFLILEFDFESVAPLAREHGLMLARQVLSDQDAGRAGALWSGLIEISLATGKTGGALDRDALRQMLVSRGFRLAGDRDYAVARAKLADMSQMTLAGIGRTVARVHLPRLEVIGEADTAMDAHRFVEIRAAPGVGKSGVLVHLAERAARQGPIIVLDPVATPAGGWIAFANALGIPGTASDFLKDMAASGGSVIFIDSLDMITDPGRQRTVNELLRAASAVPDFSVVATARSVLSDDAKLWLDENVTDGFGGVHAFELGELSDTEVAILVEQAPHLRVLLDTGHPAAKLVRNLYRLSRLLKVPSATEIRTEAQLAFDWWSSADGAPVDDVRPAQRILASLAERSLNGESGFELQSDSSARTHLLHSLTLKEVRRDRLDSYHDVLRDWAIGNWIAEDPSRLAGLDMSTPVSPRIARGIEFAARLVLEKRVDCAAWLGLLGRLSPKGAHSSWRRQAVLAIVRSEAALEQMEKCNVPLLAEGGALFAELCTTIGAVETVSTAELIKTSAGGDPVAIPRWHRTSTTGSGILTLRWAMTHRAELPVEAIGAVLDLVEILIQLLAGVPHFSKQVAAMLFGWLRQLDVRDAEVTIPGSGSNRRGDSDVRRRVVEKLRMMALVLAGFVPDQLKAYLTKVAAERDTHKVKEIRPFSQVIAPVAPAEFADLILASLLDKRDYRRRGRYSIDRAFTFADSDYLPPSPAQPPFLDLLEAAPAEGLRLVRTLVDEAVAHNTNGADRANEGLTLVFDDGPRFFPWTNAFFWSRDQANEYSMASGLKALEAWSHKRLDDGEEIEPVLADILGPEGSCAAYLLVAIDVLLSHFAQGRDRLGPFIACPELLALDGMRVARDQMDRGRAPYVGEEPAGKIKLADLKARQSREVSLKDALTNYLGKDSVAETLRQRLGEAVGNLEPYEPHSSWVDARFIGRFALNLLDLANWSDIGDGKLAYHSPPDEAAHLVQMEARRVRSANHTNTEALISLAAEGGEHATAETARIAVDFAEGGLPDGSDTDVLKSRSSRLIQTALLVARDGDDALLDEQEAWVRQVIDLGLAEESDRRSGSQDSLRFNRPATATLALIHLWLRHRAKADRNALLILAARKDRTAAPAFAEVLPQLLQTYPKVLKAAMRAAFASFPWRRHSYQEDEAEQKAFESGRAAAVRAAVEAEIAWLDGGAEPVWPEWPKERPIVRRATQIPVTGKTAIDELEADEVAGAEADEAADEASNIHVDSRSAAQWLEMINDAPKGMIGWEGEIVEAYSAWTAQMNGLGLPAEAEIDRDASEWNANYYVLFTKVLIDAPQGQFDTMLLALTSLPDQRFSDVAASVIHAADALYFNNQDRPSARPIELRTRMAQRVMALSRWKYAADPNDLRIDHETGSVVGKMLVNTYNQFSGTRSYLLPLLSDRLDPLLEPMRPLLPGGPTSFIASCVMNLLNVSPRARHLGFLLEATEAWLVRVPGNAAFWTATRVGHQIVEWFETVIGDEQALLAPEHPERERIDRLLGALVSVGVAEAHELEKKVEAAVGST